MRTFSSNFSFEEKRKLHRCVARETEGIRVQLSRHYLHFFRENSFSRFIFTAIREISLKTKFK